MDEVLQRYKEGKFQKCLELIKTLPDGKSIIDNLIIENCQLVCESLITIYQNDPDKIYKAQEELFSFYDKVTSLGIISTVPIELQLTATFNFFFWLLFYNDSEINDSEIDGYLELVNTGLLRVLGKEESFLPCLNTCEKVIENLYNLKNLISSENYKTVILVLELVIVVVMYVVKLKRKLLKECAKVVGMFISECKGVKCKVAEDEFFQIEPESLCLFKFGIKETSSIFSELDSEVVDYLYLLDSVILHLLGDFKGSLKSLQRNLCLKSLWFYLVVLNSFELKNWDLCLRFLNKSSDLVIQRNLKARFHIMRGKLLSVQRDHKEAMMEYEEALKLCPNCPFVYYNIGVEYERMGIKDSMVENFLKLVEVLENENFEDNFIPDFEIVLLDWIHPPDEITETEAYYYLAIAHGLNEDFQKAAQVFDRILQSPMATEKKPVGELSYHLTILHEAAIMNLKTGNLVRAEQIIWDAIELYIPQTPAKCQERKFSLLSKDIEWLQRLIRHELLESDLEPKELSENVFYSEELTFGFSRNVIALLILSEIQKSQGIENYRTILSEVFSLFSKYLASINKKEEQEDERVLTLIKALTGKTCLKMAEEKTKLRDDAGVEKMFKRALSCNGGDKDALCNYYAFLLKLKNKKEASKLWRTYYDRKDAIDLDAVQSFSLRYFLKTKITEQEVENIQKGIEFMTI